MPTKNNVPHCINHHNEPMERIPGFLSLNQLVEGNTTNNRRAAVPLVVFYCKKCGYVENYMADIDPAWSRFHKPNKTLNS